MPASSDDSKACPPLADHPMSEYSKDNSLLFLSSDDTVRRTPAEESSDENFNVSAESPCPEFFGAR